MVCANLWCVEMDKVEFFKWCDERNLIKSADIAEPFRLSSQTVRNWLKDVAKDDTNTSLYSWVGYACLVLDTEDDRNNSVANFPPMTFAGLADWERRHGFKTYEETAGVFGIERQAVHNWHKRANLPKWLALGCAGYDKYVEAINIEENLSAA